jgi:hypothetical protein
LSAVRRFGIPSVPPEVMQCFLFLWLYHTGSILIKRYSLMKNKGRIYEITLNRLILKNCDTLHSGNGANTTLFLTATAFRLFSFARINPTENT